MCRRHGAESRGMHAHGIKFSMAPNTDHVVGQVAHDLKLIFLPDEDRLFDQHFMPPEKGEAAGQNFKHLFEVYRQYRRHSAQRETAG